jgi:hypothetical protein
MAIAVTDAQDAKQYGGVGEMESKQPMQDALAFIARPVILCHRSWHEIDRRAPRADDPGLSH